jgi:hypothetical protein
MFFKTPQQYLYLANISILSQYKEKHPTIIKNQQHTYTGGTQGKCLNFIDGECYRYTTRELYLLPTTLLHMHNESKEIFPCSYYPTNLHKSNPRSNYKLASYKSCLLFLLTQPVQFIALGLTMNLTQSHSSITLLVSDNQR